MRKLAKTGLILYAILTGASKCEKHPSPIGELCLIGPGKSQCNDPRLEKKNYERENKEMVNYFATNPDDFRAIKDYTEEIRTKLIQCESKSKGPY